MKRKSSHVRKGYYVKPNKRRRTSFSSELSHAGGSVRSARTDGGWNYSRGIVSGTAGLLAAAATGNPYAGNLAASGTSALFGTQSNSMAGGATSGHVPFAPTTTRVGKRIKNRKAVKFANKGNVKVSKRLRKKIEKVMVSKMVQGHVKSVYAGVIGAFEGQPNEAATLDMGGIISLRGAPAASNSQYIWQTMFFADAAGVPTYNIGTDFRLFSAPRILDAASILWNNKTPALNYSVTTDNFTANVDATGKPVVAGRTGGGPQIMVKSAKATFLLKNNSQRTHYLKMLVCKPKRKATFTSPLDSWANGMAVESADTVNATQFNNQVIMFGPTATGSGLEPPIPYTVIGSMPNMSKGFKTEFKYETVEMCIEPGQTVTQVVHGPRQQQYDWSDMYLSGVNASTYAHPKFDRWVMFIGNLDLVSDTSGRVGHHYGIAGATDDKRLLALEMTLDYVLAMPEEAGFIGNAGAAVANTMQPLNARKPKIALLNFTNSINSSYNDVVRIDDENPVTGTVG